MWDLRTLAQFLGNEISPGLFQDFMDGYIKYQNSPRLLLKILEWLWLLVSNQVFPNTIPLGGQFSIPILRNLCWEEVRA